MYGNEGKQEFSEPIKSFSEEMNVPPINIVEREMFYVRAALNEKQKDVLNAYVRQIMARTEAIKKKSFFTGIVVGGCIAIAGLVAAAAIYFNFLV